MTLQLQATEYAVHAMLQVASDLEHVADAYLSSMDRVADVLPEHAAERYRDAFQGDARADAGRDQPAHRALQRLSTRARWAQALRGG